MTRLLLTGLCGLAAAALFAAGATGAGNAGTTFTFREDVHAVLDASACDAVSSDITLDGTASGWAHESVDANGVVHVNFGETIHGTGVDADGNTYRFTYHDAGSQTFSGFPTVLHLTDHFNLVGPGGQVVHTFFNALIVFEDASDPGTFIPAVVIGDPEHCDPL